MRRSSHIISADGAHWVALLCPKYLPSLGGSEKTQMHFMDKNSGRQKQHQGQCGFCLCNSCLLIHLCGWFAKSKQISRWIKNKVKDNSNPLIKLPEKSVSSSSNIQQHALEKWSGPKKDIDTC